MPGRVNRYYKIEIIIRDPSDDTDEIAEDIAFSLGGYDIESLDI